MFVDAFYSKEDDVIKISERVNGRRKIISSPASHVFYHENGNGSFKTIFGDRCKRFGSPDIKKFRYELKKTRDSGTKIFESDINPVFRYLADKYPKVELPKLNICLFDIEAGFDESKGGFAPSSNPFNEVTAISFYLNHEDTLFCFALLPPTYTKEQGEEIVSHFENTFLFTDEAELLKTFLEAIEDVDVLSGWNSEGYDIPYLINRITMILGKEATKQFCLWDQYPKPREYKSKFGNLIATYDLIGKVHLDYLQLYQKHNTQQQLSYKLDSIGEAEVGEHKIPYEGNLDDLYKKDFYKFVDYSRQDVNILIKIDKKLRFIDLASQVAHQNCVTLKTTMGSVVLVEQAIINYMHSRQMIVPDKKQKPKDDLDGLFELEEEKKPVVGAYVADPKVGLHEHIGCVDINSLYPSAIRALNMSPETIVGQIRAIKTQALVAQRIHDGIDRAEAWEGIFMLLELDHMHAEDDEPIIVDFENGKVWETTGKGLYEYIFNPDNNVCITANGTIFKTDVEGIIPSLLAEWYAERKKQQAKKDEFTERALAEIDPIKKKEYEVQVAFYEQRQYAIKILLNSLYGALLNEFLRFYDGRLGQSTTLTGRCIVKHMNGQINKTITGTEDYKGESIIYADTDSCYFSAYEFLKNDPDYADYDWSRENIIELYDAIADAANETFSDFMVKTFNTSEKRGSIIKAGRELVASKGLFIKKKKYAVLMYDKEGNRLDIDKPGKLKVMGLDLKRADTPRVMQKFLEKLLMDILTDQPIEDMYEAIKQFRIDFKDRPSWEKGSPKKVADLSKYTTKLANSNKVGMFGKLKAGEKLKVNLPGHVRASINWNTLCEMYDDKYSTRITDGTRIIVCQLKSNTFNMDSIAFPIDQPHLPEWFKSLPFDDNGMENVIIDKKLLNLVGVLSWDMNSTFERDDDDLFFFIEDEKPMIGHNGGPGMDDEGDYDEE